MMVLVGVFYMLGFGFIGWLSSHVLRDSELRRKPRVWVGLTLATILWPFTMIAMALVGGPRR